MRFYCQNLTKLPGQGEGQNAMFFICSASTHGVGPNPLWTTESIVQTSKIDGKLFTKNYAHRIVLWYESQNHRIIQIGRTSGGHPHTQQKAALATDCSTSYGTRIGLCFLNKLSDCNRK